MEDRIAYPYDSLEEQAAILRNAENTLTQMILNKAERKDIKLLTEEVMRMRRDIGQQGHWFYRRYGSYLNK